MLDEKKVSTVRGTRVHKMGDAPTREKNEKDIFASLNNMIRPKKSNEKDSKNSKKEETGDKNLRGKIALVTGSSRGLGLLIARELGLEGCRLVICARDETELKDAQLHLRDWGVTTEVMAVKCDVTERAQVERMISDAVNHFGQIDILVNNVGIIQVGPLANMSVEDFEKAMQTDFYSMIYATLSVLPAMKTRGEGRIVNITSIGGKVSIPHLLPYGAAKFAAVGFSEGLYTELAGTGVSVTTVVPGLLRTGSHLNALFKGDKEGEFTWFSLGASSPFMAMDAEVAARRVVQATKNREVECILSLPANVAARFNGLFPGLTQRVANLTNKVILPKPQGSASVWDVEKGKEVLPRKKSPVFDFVTTLGRNAAKRFNQW